MDWKLAPTFRAFNAECWRWPSPSVVGDDAWCAEWHFERTKRANPRMAMLHVFLLLKREGGREDGEGNWHAGNWHLRFSQTSCMPPPPIFIALLILPPLLSSIHRPSRGPGPQIPRFWSFDVILALHVTTHLYIFVCTGLHESRFLTEQIARNLGEMGLQSSSYWNCLPRTSYYCTILCLSLQRLQNLHRRLRRPHCPTRPWTTTAIKMRKSAIPLHPPLPSYSNTKRQTLHVKYKHYFFSSQFSLQFLINEGNRRILRYISSVPIIHAECQNFTTNDR